MKKMFFYAAIAAVAFASCSKDKGIELPNNGVEEETTMEAIQFAVGNTIEVTTRGTGGVGDVVDSLNVWKGQKLNVYMFDKGTMTLAINPTAGDDVAYFANDTITAPNNSTASGEANYVGTKYYTSNGKYDFFAYHADSAVTTTPKEVKEGDKVIAYAAPFTIDGTQDLMIAKAWLNSADSIAFAKECKINHQIVDGNIVFTTTAQADTFKTLSSKHVYSAYAARRGVQPRFAFKHYLTRLIFTAEAMEDGVANTMSIDSVKIFNTKITGTMTVAALDASKLGVVFDDQVTGDLNLVSRNCDTLTIQKFTKKGEILRLGESLLVAPNENSYKAKIYYSQVKPNGTENDTIHNSYDATIKLDDKATKAFKAGYQYKVNVKVYDNKPIVLTADLLNWGKGEDVDLDSEE